MKTMQDYTIYCTDEQTRRAFKLGAPIKKITNIFNVDNGEQFYRDNLLYVCMGDFCCVLPTIDQMCKWLLKENGLLIEIRSDGSKFVWCLREFPGDKSFIQAGITNSDDEAFVAAINAALDHLEKKGE